MQASPHCSAQDYTGEWSKATRVIRDLLVLKACIGGGPWTTSSLKLVMEQLFDHQLDDQVHSHIMLSFTTMRRLSRSRAEFDAAAWSTYGEALDAGAANALFVAYSCLAIASPHWESNTKRLKGHRPPRPGKSKKTSSSTTGAAGVVSDTDAENRGDVPGAAGGVSDTDAENRGDVPGAAGGVSDTDAENR